MLDYTEFYMCLPNPIEFKVLHLIDATGHIFNDDTIADNDLLRIYRENARKLVNNGWLIEQDPNEFDFTNAGHLAYKYICTIQ